MKTLIVNKDGTTSFLEVGIPQYTAEQALVKVIACGMCGTDVKLLHGTFKGFPETAYPLMLGHEGVGEIIAVGNKVKSLQIGDRVLLPFVNPKMIDRSGIGSAWGALSEYAVVDDLAAYPQGEAPDCAYAQTVLNKTIDPVDAVMIITLREVLSCIRYIGIQPADSIVIFGSGPVGLTYMRILSLLGIRSIIACDIADEKLEQAKEAGANYTINNKTRKLNEFVRNIFPDGVDYVLDAAGFPAIVNQGIQLLRDRGKIICYGVPEKSEITIDFTKAVYNWQMIYQQFPIKKEEGMAHAQIMDWIRSGEINLKDFISDYFIFSEAIEAYRNLLDKKVAKKGVIVMD